jgi:hypothetical protein
MAIQKTYQSFKEFYPYYLTEHARPINHWLHFVGTLGVITCFVLGLVTANGKLLFFMPFCGYGFAWFGHFVFEKNRPATFTYPLYSLGSDFVMFWHILTGQITKKMDEAHQICRLDNKWKTQ